MSFKLSASKLLLISGLFVFFILLIPNAVSADVCADVPKGGTVNYVLNEATAPTNNSCTFDGTVNGVDGVGITIDEGYSLTINAGQTIVWSPNKSVIINGSIAITTGGQLKQTYIWMTDDDDDGYPPDATQYDTEPAGGKRRKDFTNFTYVSNITYDFDDDPATGASIFPGQACEDYYGAECNTHTAGGCDGRRFKKSNTNAGTCTTDNPIESDYDDACTDVDCGTCCKCSAATAGYDDSQDADCPADTQYQEGGSPNYCQSSSKPGTCASLDTCNDYGAWGNINGGETCQADGAYYDDGADSATGTNSCKHPYYQCSSGTCTSYTATDATCGTCAYCNVSSCAYFPASQQGPTADSYYDSGGDSAESTNSCILRDYHCTGSSAAETYDDSTAATCGLCQYCNGSSCATYAANTKCATCKKCSGTSCNNTSTSWNAGGAYGCSGSTKRCDTGTCRTCDTGVVHSDNCGGCAGQGGNVCWHLGADAASCTTSCGGSHGGCLTGNWDDDSSCTVMKHWSGCSDCCDGSSGRTNIPSLNEDWSTTCMYRAGDSQLCGGTPGWGSHRRICACRY